MASDLAPLTRPQGNVLFSFSRLSKPQAKLMLLLKDAQAFELSHRASCWLRGASSQSLLVAASREGSISLCRLEPAPNIIRLSARGKIASTCPHPTLPLLALIEGETGRLRVLRFDGSLLFEEAGTRLPEQASAWMPPAHGDCWFDDSGTHLWRADRASNHKVDVLLIETDRWSVISRSIVDDPLGDSSASFHPTGSPETLAFWLAAGQDGQRTYWLTRQGDTFRCAFAPALNDSVPPAFSPSRKEFMTITESGRLLKFRYPSAQLLGGCESPFGKDDDLVDQVCYLNDRYALAATFKDRIVVVDTRAMRAVGELVIEGHVPGRTEEYYPELAGDKSVCTDISYFKRVGDLVVFVYHLYSPSDRLADWRDALLCFPVRHVLERLEAWFGGQSEFPL